MSPPVDSLTKLLPSRPDRSPHPGLIADVEKAFVVDAPHSAHRRVIFDAFKLYSELLWGHFPNAVLWLNGGFVTHKASAPHDLDVAFLVGSAELTTALTTNPNVYSLLTLQGVNSVQPIVSHLPRLQPFGGLIDSFYIPSDVPAAVQTWRDRWSLAPNVNGTGYRNDVHKGYVEVTR